MVVLKTVKAFYVLSIVSGVLVVFLLNFEGYFQIHTAVKGCLVTRGDTTYVLTQTICDLQVDTTQLEGNRDFRRRLYNDYSSWLDTWQNVSRDGSMVVFSAFPDNTPDESYIRVLVLFKLGDNNHTVPEVGCLVHSHDFGTVQVTEAANIDVMPEHHGKLYKPAFVMCPLSEPTARPQFVSLVIMDRIAIHKPRNLVKVTYNAGASHNFTVCLSPLFFRNNVALELVQWIEMNRILGADVFYIYNYTSNTQTNYVLRHYASAGLVRIIQWELSYFIQSTEDVHYYGQMAAINDCLYRSKGVSKYLVNVDLDEFIFPRGASNTWNDILARENESFDYTIRSTVVVMDAKRKPVNGNIFISQANSTSAKNSSLQNVVGSLNLIDNSANNLVKHFNLFTLSKQTRRQFVFESTIRSKYIVRPDCIDILGIHFVWEYSSISCGARHDVSMDNAMVYHYANPSSPFANGGRTQRDEVTNKYKDRLITAVSETWKRLFTQNNTLSRISA